MKTTRSLAAVAAGGLLLAGCGGGDKPAATTAAITAQTDGAKVFGGSFANVKGAPPNSPAVVGTAEMIVAQGKTRVTILVTGLDNKAAYIAHVHDDVCSAPDPGGAHFKFDPNGGDQPPNEIHLNIQFEVNRQGDKLAAITSDVTVEGAAGESAKSVVIHLKRARGAGLDAAKPPKLACADLKAT
ncbi:MAG: hypothetical protein ACT4QG_03410 [Sporichthyaceae bacterium]